MLFSNLFSVSLSTKHYLYMNTCIMSLSPQGLYISGVIGDRMNLRYVLSAGLCGSAVVVCYYVNIYFWFILQFIARLHYATVLTDISYINEITLLVSLYLCISIGISVWHSDRVAALL